jgi:four helix bundle protein
MGHFKNLKAWEHARRLVIVSKPAIARLPPEETNALADQWRRAAYSVALNIAEGASRRGSREFRRYLDTARGSLHEVEGILDLAQVQGYLSADEVATIESVRAECARTVYGLLRKLSDSL